MTDASQAQATGRRRNPRGAGDRLREDLITAASEMIAESGDTSQLTLRGVAKRVGIAAPSIYRHFPDAEHLKMAVVERSFATFAAARESASRHLADPAEALLAGCRAYCQFALDHPGPYRFMFSHEIPAADRTPGPVGLAAFQGLVSSIRRCQDTGTAHAPDDPEHLAAQVWAALHGMVMLRMNAPHFPWPAPLDQMADQAVTRLVVLGQGSPHEREKDPPGQQGTR
jgi:AcrR family transcriptional regulator